MVPACIGPARGDPGGTGAPAPAPEEENQGMRLYATCPVDTLSNEGGFL